MSTVTQEPGKTGDNESIDRRLNLGTLPISVHRSAAIQQAFDSLEPGESLLILDDYPTDWVLNCLKSYRAEQLDWTRIRCNKNAGRHQIRVTRLPRQITT